MVTIPMNPFKLYRVGSTAYRRGNPFIPFPYPNALFHIWVKGRLFFAYPLFPFQKSFWVNIDKVEPGTKHFGPFFLSRKLK